MNDELEQGASYQNIQDKWTYRQKLP